jgi:hypothetical protein
LIFELLSELTAELVAHEACAELSPDERLRGAINTTKMPYNIAYVAKEQLYILL